MPSIVPSFNLTVKFAERRCAVGYLMKQGPLCLCLPNMHPLVSAKVLCLASLQISCVSLADYSSSHGIRFPRNSSAVKKKRAAEATLSSILSTTSANYSSDDEKEDREENVWTCSLCLRLGGISIDKPVWSFLVYAHL